ncbi:MAG: band 7 protein [Microthrixaceae bacterium]|nr:band 7 protein [Microthrixaceae bacterium]
MKQKFKGQRGSTGPFYLFEVLIVIAVMLGLGYTAYWFGSRGDSAANEVCVVYSGGTFEDKRFVKIMDPGQTKENIGWGSEQYCYRNDQRSYIAAAKEGADTKPVEVVGGGSGDSGSNVRLVVDYQLYFKLNLEPKMLRKFHENIGVKTQGWTEDGWNAMLRDYFEPQIERSLEAAALQYGWDKLYSDEATRRAFQADTVQRLKGAIKEVVGDDYFCGPDYVAGGECGDFTFTVGKPQLANQDLIAAIESEETAKRQTQAQSEKNATAQSKLEIDRELIEMYGPQGALIAKAIESGKVTFYVLPDGSTVPVPAPAPKE